MYYNVGSCHCESGYLYEAFSYWLLAVGYWLLVIGFWILADNYKRAGTGETDN